jgi:hypothetical protein
MGYAKILPIIAIVVLLVSGCMVIESLDQPYEAESGKAFTTTLVARTPEATEDEEETFVHGVLGFSVPPGWEIESVKTVEGEIKPGWVKIPPGGVTTEVMYGGEGGYPWTFFRTDERYSTIEHANKAFTAEVKIKPSSAGRYELGYVSGAAEGADASGKYSPDWGYNEVNGGQVVFKRIWVK